MYLDSKIRGDETNINTFDSKSSFSLIFRDLLRIMTECENVSVINIIGNHTGFNMKYILEISEYHRKLHNARETQKHNTDKCLRILSMSKDKYKAFFKEKYHQRLRRNNSGSAEVNARKLYEIENNKRDITVFIDPLERTRPNTGIAFLHLTIATEKDFDFVGVSIGRRESQLPSPKGEGLID